MVQQVNKYKCSALASMCALTILMFGLPAAAQPETSLPSPGSNREELGTALPGAPQRPESDIFSDRDTPPPPPSGRQLSPFDAPVQQERTPEEIQKDIRERAFNAAVTGLLPMRPGEIRALLEKWDETQQAVEVPVYPYPQPEIVVKTLSLDPGARPPEIKVAVGHVATLNILDITGAPWPIQDISWGGNFEIINPESGSSVLRITPMSEFAYGNMSIRLVGLQTPVTFTIKTHRDSVHYRFDARVPEYGPEAVMPIIENSYEQVAGDSVLGAILDGVPPEGAVRLNIAGVDGRTSAYSYDSVTYVRTPLTLLSPGWSSSVSSADGMNVYATQNAPVLLLSDRGRMVRARVRDRESADER